MLSTSTTIHTRAQELRDALAEGEEIPRGDLAQLADDMIGWAETVALLQRQDGAQPRSPLAGQARHYNPVFEVLPPRRPQIVSLTPVVLAWVAGGGLVGAVAGSLIGHLFG